MAKLGSSAGWHGNYCEDLTEAKTLGRTDSGKVLFLNATSEFTTTLPSIANIDVGWNCKIIVKAAPDGAAYTVTENTSTESNKVVVNGINELEVDTTNDGPYHAAAVSISFADGVAVKGDWVEFLCDGTNWYVTGQTNADGGIAIGT